MLSGVRIPVIDLGSPERTIKGPPDWFRIFLGVHHNTLPLEWMGVLDGSKCESEITNLRISCGDGASVLLHQGRRPSSSVTIIKGEMKKFMLPELARRARGHSQYLYFVQQKKHYRHAAVSDQV